MLAERQKAAVAAWREHIRADRLRTVTLIRMSAGITTYETVPCTWKEEGNVEPGVTNRVGEVTRRGWDVTAEFPPNVDFADVAGLADTPDPAQVPAARTYRILDRLHLGLTGEPDRVLVKLARVR
jgi:hypothetical protein